MGFNENQKKLMNESTANQKNTLSFILNENNRMENKKTYKGKKLKEEYFSWFRFAKPVSQHRIFRKWKQREILEYYIVNTLLETLKFNN